MQGKKSKRKNKGKGNHSVDVPLPPTGAGPLPNPRLDIKNSTNCNHGCEIATTGTKAHDILYNLITGLNAGVDGALGPVEDAEALKLRSIHFVKEFVNDFDEVWGGRGVATDALGASLTSIGTDCLLMEGISQEGKLKMATAIAGMIYDIQKDYLLDKEDFTRGKTIIESIRKSKDIICAGERETVGFFSKKISCDCLKIKYKQLKKTQEKIGKCDNCAKTFELKQLKQCAKCKFVQVID